MKSPVNVNMQEKYVNFTVGITYQTRKSKK